MSHSVLALTVASLLFAPPGESVPVQEPGSADAAEPEESTQAPSGQRRGLEEVDFGGGSEPEAAPEVAPEAEPEATAAPAPAAAPVDEAPALVDEPNGVGLLIAGPLTIALGIPLAFAGNVAWRDACGPTTSARECAGGSTLSALSHTIAGIAFTGGAVLLGVGGHRRGAYDAHVRSAQGRRLGNRAGFIVVGAIILPAAVIGLGTARLFFWLPTPECQTASCVRNYQTMSTLTVSGLALGAGLGAGMLMYGAGYNRVARRHGRVSLTPTVGRRHAGLTLTGRF